MGGRPPVRTVHLHDVPQVVLDRRRAEVSKRLLRKERRRERKLYHEMMERIAALDRRGKEGRMSDKQKKPETTKLKIKLKGSVAGVKAAAKKIGKGL